jgi:DNA-binding NarL/FixJ family response regulator
VLLDLHFDETHSAEGLDCLRALRAMGYPGLAVVVSGDSTFTMAHRAAMAGAHGYLVKEQTVDLTSFLRLLLEPCTKDEFLPPAAEAYLRSRGLDDRDVELLREYCVDFGHQKSVAARLERSHSAVRKQFERIRDLIGARSQVELGRILGVLSCFARVEDVW